MYKSVPRDDDFFHDWLILRITYWIKYLVLIYVLYGYVIGYNIYMCWNASAKSLAIKCHVIQSSEAEKNHV